jgi:stress-induced morphogen
MSTQTFPQHIHALADALRRDFPGTVEVELVSGTNRFRIAVVSDRFERMPHLKRQDEVWRLVDAILDREQSLQISMLLTYAPSEIES